ncbi:hypothetical protein HG535_0H03350 [Zygotorulaspora mrakii]|uniref:Uncharacterized protein n=1 Tax=Zygotorulaspora mrakii TaxID=42260 RepID=A0A7H9B8C5_ZYGMR|nr:uncharacterized protein HG535_0H03350 [Zygotorulaspora mrakii]QLG75008.1 hypothetical protein HG535_0H03350 [Zygotorulaspora mrakii]
MSKKIKMELYNDTQLVALLQSYGHFIMTTPRIINVVGLAGSAKLEEEDIIAFLERYRYDRQHRMNASSETCLDTELLQKLVQMNGLPTNAAAFEDSTETASRIVEGVKSIQLEQEDIVELPAQSVQTVLDDEQDDEQDEKGQESTRTVKDAHIRKTLRRIHQFSSGVCSRMKNGIRLQTRKKRDDYRQEDIYNEKSDYNYDSSSLPLGLPQGWLQDRESHEQSHGQVQWQWDYSQLQSALMTYSTALSDNNTVVRNSRYPYPTVESRDSQREPSTINVLKLIQPQ